MDVVVIQKPNNEGVIYSFPKQKALQLLQETNDISIFGESYSGLNYIIADYSEVPPSDSSIGSFHSMIYFDGECKKENLKQDKEWNVMLMPEFMIRSKHKANLTSKIDEELDKQFPDPVKIMGLQRKREKIGGWTQLDCYEQALANLDEKVQKGEPDKPIIRNKLKAKINELKK